ncbi:MAG: hypothetical protein ACI80F_000701 [Natronomonas sp.]|jgi:hypothetical protein|uniref:hypothetical protein n=1 Tax=Natronomonas sp. TaxID=2184060 RepID=UPI00398A008C
MSRTVPEAAPLVGLVLSFAFALFGFLFSSNHLATALVAVLLLYPFVAFGIIRSDSPDDVFFPDPVLAAGFLGASAVFLYGIVSGQLLFGALVASVIAVPPVLYHARLGESVNPLPPDTSLVVGLLFAAGFLLYGAVDNLLAGALAAVAVGFGTVDYRRQRGGPLASRTRTIALVCCLGAGLVGFGILTATGRPTEGLAVGGVLVALGAFIAFGAELQQPR